MGEQKRELETGGRSALERDIDVAPGEVPADDELYANKAKRPALSWFLALGAALVALICLVFGIASVFATALGVHTEIESFYLLLPSSPLFKRMLAGIVCGVALVGASFALARKAERVHERLFVSVLAAIAFAFCLGWIYINGTETNLFSDSQQILLFAKQLAAGDYSSFLPHSVAFTGKLAGDMYLSNYPFQSGILLCMEGFVRVFGGFAVQAFQVANAVAAVSSACTLVRMTRLLGRPKAERLVCALLAFTFMPALIFVIFPYGNAIGFAFALAAVELWVRSRGERSGRELALLMGAFVLLAIGLMIKSTYLIVAIGALIVLLIDCVRKRTPLAAVLMVVSLLAANSFAGALPAKVMEARLGYSLGENQPKIAWIAMGLSNDNVFDGMMPGWWGSSALASQIANEGDVEGQERDARERIERSLKDFAENPAYALWFFAKKLGNEWLDPSFQSFYIADISTMTPEAAAARSHSQERDFDPWDISFAHGYVSHAVFVYMDGYESVVLLAACVGAVVLFKRARSGENDTLDYLLPCAFFMGFFVYVLWEAKGMYCMPFFFCLLPLAARGLCTMMPHLERHVEARLSARTELV